MNFGLTPKRFGAAATALYPGCYWVTRDTIKFSKKTRAVQVSIDYDFSLCRDAYTPGWSLVPLVRFTENDPQQVLECGRWP